MCFYEGERGKEGENENKSLRCLIYPMLDFFSLVISISGVLAWLPARNACGGGMMGKHIY